MATAVLGSLLSGGAGPLLTGIGNVINSIRGKDPAAAAALQALVEQHSAEFRLAELDQQNKELAAAVTLAGQQTDTNKLDAQSEKLLQYGWRPIIGWICGAGLGYQFLLRPLLSVVISALLVHAKMSTNLIEVPALDMATLLDLLIGMLGLGGLRTVEKVKAMNVPGVAIIK